ncbi:MAG: hypothetical protein KAH32_07225 [Chlamydiia bacterium]|nr:hypothetical protein [Chlamydiia bacterium]
MNRSDIDKVLRFLGTEPCNNQNRNGWRLAPCVYAPWKHKGGIDKNPSFGVVEDDEGISRYNCFSCDSHGDLGDMVIELKHLGATSQDGYDFANAMQLIANEETDAELFIPDYDEVKDLTPKTIPYSAEYIESFKSAKFFPKAMEYLHSRSMSFKEIHEFQVRFDVSKQRVCFPIKDFNGNYVGLRGRSIGLSDYPWHQYNYNNQSNKLVWFGEHGIDLDDPVILCESVFDLIRIKRHYKNVMCSLSCGISKFKAKRISGALDVITFYDYGTGGDVARASLDKYLKHSAIIHLVPTKSEGDPGAMTDAQIRDYLKPHLKLNKLLG